MGRARIDAKTAGSAARRPAHGDTAGTLMRGKVAVWVVDRPPADKIRALGDKRSIGRMSPAGRARVLAPDRGIPGADLRVAASPHEPLGGAEIPPRTVAGRQ